MSYIGTSPTTAAFPFDQFSGTGSLTAFTLSYAPASTTSIIVAVSGVVQNPNTYSVGGYVLTFTGAPPLGTNNIAVLYLGLPSSGVSTPGNTAYRSATDYTATAGQTTFATVGSYTVGFLDVYRNGSRLGSADFTATNGTTVVLAAACALTNALPLTGGTVTGSTAFNSNVSINGGDVSGYTGFKNRIINGSMMIDQRNAGSAFTLASGTNAYGSCDRWASIASAASWTMQQIATGNFDFPYALRLKRTAAAAASTIYVGQIIESMNCLDMAGQAVTLSFYITAGATFSGGTFTAEIYTGTGANQGWASLGASTWTGQTLATSNAPVPTTTRTKYSYTVTLGPTVSEIGIRFWYAATGTAGATDYVDITGVQLERGSNATSFEFRSIGQELSLCQRYYWRHTATGVFTQFGFATSRGSAASEFFVQYPVTMRAIATTLDYASLKTSLYAGGTSQAVTSATLSTANLSNSAGVLNLTSAASIGSAGQALQVIADNSASAYIGFGAELT